MKLDLEVNDNIGGMLKQIAEAYNVTEAEILERALYTFGFAVGAIQMSSYEEDTTEQEKEAEEVASSIITP
jgi:predicted alpha/beta-fold hydrolase